MAWTADVAFVTGLGFFSDAVATVRQPADWQRPSPCAGWRAIDVLGHVGIGTEFGTRLLRGEQPEWKPVDPPGEAVAGDPAQWWSALVTPARDAVSGVDLSTEVDSPAGRRTIGAGLSFPALDLFVHAWDLARSAGGQVEIPVEAIEFAHSVLDGIPPEMMRSTKVFAAESAPPADGTASDRFLAWTGRDPEWAGAL